MTDAPTPIDLINSAIEDMAGWAHMGRPMEKLLQAKKLLEPVPAAVNLLDQLAENYAASLLASTPDPTVDDIDMEIGGTEASIHFRVEKLVKEALAKRQPKLRADHILEGFRDLADEADGPVLPTTLTASILDVRGADEATVTLNYGPKDTFTLTLRRNSD